MYHHGRVEGKSWARGLATSGCNASNCRIPYPRPAQVRSYTVLIGPIHGLGASPVM